MNVETTMTNGKGLTAGACCASDAFAHSSFVIVV